MQDSVMINGDPNEFLDHVYSGQDTPYDYVWQCSGPDPQDCLEKFLSVPIFGGKCFLDAEQGINWLDI